MINTDTINSGIIFSNNSSFAYKFRTKASRLGIHTEYRHTLQELLDYMFDNKEGIVFVDNGSVKYQTYLKKFSLTQLSRNFSIVFIEDNCDIKVKCDNIFTFHTSYNTLQDVIPTIISIMNSRRNRIDSISNDYIDKYLRLIVKEFNLPENMTGYEYINDCVKLYLTSLDKKYNIIKEVYGVVAKRYMKNVSNIEKSIRLVISSAINKNPEPFINAFKKDKVTNSCFIAYIVDKVKLMHTWNLKYK